MKRAVERDYFVLIPVHGTASKLVKARTAAEAERKVWDSDPDVVALDFNIEWEGKPRARRAGR